VSSGAVVVPFFNLVCWHLEVCQFYHITQLVILPPHIDVTLQWAPSEDNAVQLIFALTFGTPRDFSTGETVYTTDVGFWHRGRGMKYHWEIRFYNYTGRAIAMDVSVWVFEYSIENYERFMSVVRGFSKLLRLIDAVLPDNIDMEAAARYLAEFIRAVKSAGG
jgi:hypothetical protein